MCGRRETAGTGVRGSSMKDRDRDLFFKATVARQCAMRQLKKYQLADKMGMPHSTFDLKLRCPGRFSVDEMRDLCNILQFSVEDKTALI